MTENNAALGLHHFGYVVEDVAAAAPAFAKSMAAQWTGRIYEDPHQKVRVTFLTTRPGDAQIELVEPAGDDSPVRRFLEERGGGLHHICYEVERLEECMAEMKSRGALTARPPKPATAFGGRRIAWVLTAEKLLVELLEKDGGETR